MTDINRVVLIGRLTRDAETKFTQAGQAVCKFSIAVNRKRKVGEQWEEEASFFDAVLWGRQAEGLNQYLIKGKQVAIDGELRQDRWEQDGQKRSKVEIYVNNLELLGGGQGAGGGSYPARTDAPSGNGNWGGASTAPRSGPAPARDEELHDNFSDDIPF
jgi:single-strand DNA-binding protein